MTPHPVILFDGVCNLCNALVQFVIRHDPKHHFYFASLQSVYGQQVLNQYGLPADSYNSFILLEGDKVYTRSTAALRVAGKLSGVWPILYIFIIVPPLIRNAVYNMIAKRRYKWFGRREECMVPAPEVKELFMS